MKRKKVLKGVLSSTLIGLCLMSAVSCSKDDDKDDQGQTASQKFTVTFDSKGGSDVTSKEVETGSKVTKPADPTKSGYTFSGWYKDSGLTEKFNFDTDTISAAITLFASWTADAPAVTKYTVTFNVDGGSSIEDQSINEGSKVSKPSNPTKDKYVFDGWYTNKSFATEFNFDTATITEATTIYAKWELDIPEGYEKVTYELLETSFLNGKTDSDILVGNYTIKSGAEMRDRAKTWENPDNKAEKISFTRSLKLGKPANLTVKAPGNGKLSIWIQNGSSGIDTQIITFGKVGDAKEIEFTGGTNPVVKLEFDVEEGETYEIGRPSGTVDLYKASMVCVVEKSEVSGISLVGGGIVNYLEGQSYDSSKINLNLVYGNGRTEVLPINSTGIVIDSSKFVSGTPGVYTITVKYKEFEAVSFDVTVYKAIGLEAYTSSIASVGNNGWGNGVLATKNVKQIFATEASFNSDELIVYGIGQYNGKTVDFKLKPSEYQINKEKFDNTTAGTYVITVEGFGQTADYEVSVVDTKLNKVGDVAKVKVNANYIGTIGAVEGGYNMFTSLTTALQFIEANLIKDDKIELYVCNGTYKEKIDINVPNLTLIGESATGTIITFDAANGLADPNGTLYGTDASATVAIREAAVNFKAANITFKNEYNTLAAYTALGLITKSTQSEALIVQADSAIFYNCILTGYHDTLQLQGAGRQYFKNCLITGATDFIFGTNSSALFEECEIRTIGNGTSDNGGYITAMKGFNKKAGEDITQHGIIFNNCDFTADEATPEGKTAIGRPWGTNASVVVMNSRLGKHISKVGYTKNTDKGQRYVVMDGRNPNDEGTAFEEYNNTGDGAITTAVVGMSFLDKETADNLLVDFFKAYTLNGTTFKFDAWTIVLPEVDQEDLLVLPQLNTVTFNTNNGAANTSKEVVSNSKLKKPTEPKKTGNIFTGWYTDVECTEEFDFDNDVITSAITLYAGWEDGTVEYGTVNTTWYFNATKADKSKNEYLYADTSAIQGTGATFDWKGLSIDASGTSAKIQARTSDTQFNTNTIIKFNVKAGATVKFNVYNASKYSVDGIAIDSTDTSKVITRTYTSDTLVVLKATANDYIYSIIVTYPADAGDDGDDSGETQTNVTWYLNGTAENSKNNEFSYDGNLEKNTLEWHGLSIDASTGKFSYNASGYTQMNATTTISFEVKAGATVRIVSYEGQAKYNVNDETGTTVKSNTYDVPVTEDGTFRITSFGTGYLYSISVTYPAE